MGGSHHSVNTTVNLTNLNRLQRQVEIETTFEDYIEAQNILTGNILHPKAKKSFILDWSFFDNPTLGTLQGTIGELDYKLIGVEWEVEANWFIYKIVYKELVPLKSKSDDNTNTENPEALFASIPHTRQIRIRVANPTTSDPSQGQNARISGIVAESNQDHDHHHDHVSALKDQPEPEGGGPYAHNRQHIIQISNIPTFELGSSEKYFTGSGNNGEDLFALTEEQRNTLLFLMQYNPDFGQPSFQYGSYSGSPNDIEICAFHFELVDNPSSEDYPNYDDFKMITLNNQEYKITKGVYLPEIH